MQIRQQTSLVEMQFIVMVNGRVDRASFVSTKRSQFRREHGTAGSPLWLLYIVVCVILFDTDFRNCSRPAKPVTNYHKTPPPTTTHLSSIVWMALNGHRTINGHYRFPPIIRIREVFLQSRLKSFDIWLKFLSARDSPGIAPYSTLRGFGPVLKSPTVYESHQSPTGNHY